jgi:hypothetical protein
MKRIHSLLILLVVTILVSAWGQGQWNIKYIAEALFIAICIELVVIFAEIRSEYLLHRRPKVVFQFIDYLKTFEIRRKLSVRYSNEQEKMVFENLIEIAMISLKSDDPAKKRAGLEQLYAIEPQVNGKNKVQIYNGLVDAFHQEDNKVFKRLLQESICEFFKICRDFL